MVEDRYVGCGLGCRDVPQGQACDRLEGGCKVWGFRVGFSPRELLSQGFFSLRLVKGMGVSGKWRLVIVRVLMDGGLWECCASRQASERQEGFASGSQGPGRGRVLWFLDEDQM